MALRLQSPITRTPDAANVMDMHVAVEDDPRRISTGTSYDAKGILDPDPKIYVERGSSGFFQTRDIPALANRSQRTTVFKQMANNDVGVDVSLRAGKAPVQGADYFVEAADDSDEAQVVAEFVEFNLLEGTSQPFLTVLSDILRMYDYGFSVLEAVYELREWAPKAKGANKRKYTMLRKLTPLPAPTIKQFVYDDFGGPVGVVHNALRADGKVEQDVEIDIDKLIIFTMEKEGGNLEGRSLLRTAYKHWYYKDNLYKIDAIQKERHALGIPDIELPMGYNDGDKKLAHELGRNLRTNEFAYIVRVPGMNVGFAKFEGELADVMKSIEHHNGMIMLNVMVQFLLMGMQEGGGRATSASHQNMFEKSLKYVANLICEYFNLYLVPRLVAYNFNTTKFPRLQCRNIGEMKDLQQWASGVANLLSQNLITADYDTEQWARKIADMPLKKGGRQTPENNASKGFMNNKGGVQTEGDTDNSGNIGKGADEA